MARSRFSAPKDTTAEIATHDHVFTPGRYVGAEEVEDDAVNPSRKKRPVSSRN